MSGIKVCLTNNGKSEWLPLPTSRTEALVAFRKIGTEDGDYRITDCESGFGAKFDAMIAGANLDTANYLAARISKLSPGQIDLLEAILEHLPDVLCDISRVIDFPDNAGAYEIYSDVHRPEELALYYINESGSIQMPEEWAEGIDLKKFGKNLEKHEPGHYTKHGYLIATDLDWTPVFEKNSEVPLEYCITKK